MKSKQKAKSVERIRKTEAKLKGKLFQLPTHSFLTRAGRVYECMCVRVEGCAKWQVKAAATTLIIIHM